MGDTVNDTYSGPSLYGSDTAEDTAEDRTAPDVIGTDGPTTDEVEEVPALNEHGQSVPLRSTFPDTIEVN